MERIDDIRGERSPFEAVRKTRQDIRNFELDGMKGPSEDDILKQLAAGTALELQLKNRLDTLNAINALEQQGVELTAEQSDEVAGLAEEYSVTSYETSDVVKEVEKAYKKQKKHNETIKKGASNYKKLSKDQQAAFRKTTSLLDEIQKLVDNSIELMETLGVATDSVVMPIAQGVSSMVSLIKSAVEFGAQMVILGYQSNMALGVIGWIAIAIQAVATILKAAFTAKDNQLKQQIEALAEKAELLQEKFESLQESLDKVFSIKDIEETNKAIDKTNKLLVANLEAQIALQKERKQTKEVKDEIKELEQQITEANQAIKDAKDEIYSILTGGVFDDFNSVALDFVDSWADAFGETQDGLTGLEESFKEMFMNVAKQQAALLIVGEFTKKWQTMLKKYINEDDMRLTPEDAQQWAAEVQATFPELNALLEAFLGTIMKTTDAVGEGSLTGLEEGIAGASEETVQIVAAYLNSIRFFVADNNAVLKQLRDYVFGDGSVTNPMLVQLRIIAEQTKAIHTLLNSVTQSGHPRGQSGIRVFMD